MRIVAVIMVRNGVDYVEKCIQHLIKNNIEVAIIDQSSDDGTYEICQEYINQGLCQLTQIDYPGYFSLEEQLYEKQKVIEALHTDWVIHHDIDECLEAPNAELSLFESIVREDQQGYTVVNFNEFVFLPYNEYPNYYDSLYYYFFEPCSPRLMRAWKKNEGFSGIKSGGHLLQGNINLSPVNHIMRHYVFTSQRHAFEKYSERKFSKGEVKIGWHKNRIDLRHEKMIFPDRANLECLPKNESSHFVTINPWRKHFWE